MLLAARSWGIQPSEFWEMTLSEWLLEANYHWERSPEAEERRKKEIWLEDAELTAEDWKKKYGSTPYLHRSGG